MQSICMASDYGFRFIRIWYLYSFRPTYSINYMLSYIFSLIWKSYKLVISLNNTTVADLYITIDYKI